MKSGPESDKDGSHSEASAVYSAIDDISHLLGNSMNSNSKVSIASSSGGESLTGGVGTTFYRAPEQEGVASTPFGTKSDSFSYTVKADLFGLGVILFELFHPPFETYMERAETLTTLRGDRSMHPHHHNSSSQANDQPQTEGDQSVFASRASERFPPAFIASVPGKSPIFNE